MSPTGNRGVKGIQVHVNAHIVPMDYSDECTSTRLNTPDFGVGLLAIVAMSTRSADAKTLSWGV
jgi:hypothetical protein